MITHAGLENVEIPLPEWRERYKELIDMGCDAVIGGHPHICQGYEKYKGRYIIYSLGNFCFNKRNPVKKTSWYKGEVVVLDINKQNIKMLLYGIKCVDNCIDLVDTKEWEDEINRLNGLLKDDVYVNQVECISSRFLDHYYNQISSAGFIRFDKYLFKSIARIVLKKTNEINLLNTIQCESHRWCFSRALKIKNYE